MSLRKEDVNINVLMRLMSLSHQYGYTFVYCDEQSPEFADGLAAHDEGRLADRVYVGPCTTSQRVWEIGLHEIGHAATVSFARSQHAKVFTKDYQTRYSTPEYAQILHQIPVERAAWEWAYRKAIENERQFSLSGYWFAFKCMFSYRICNGGEKYRYERMNWFARRRVDIRAIIAILF
jgi:hypothetical protein